MGLVKLFEDTPFKGVSSLTGKYMKKFLSFLITSLLLLTANQIFAVEIKVQGTGKASIINFDVSAARAQQDEKANKASNKNQSESKSNKQIKQAIKQADKRKKQDTELRGSIRTAVVKEAQKNALQNAINILLDRTLGAGANKDASVRNKLDEIYSQEDVYVLDKQFAGDVLDSDYIAKVSLTVDETAFRELISDMGIALNTQKVRQSAILVVMDEFFAEPSHLKPTPSREVITSTVTKEQKNVKRANAKASQDDIEVSYGEFSDLSTKDSEFNQRIIEYASAKPIAENLNYTQPALVNAFTTYDIRSLDNDVFKSRFFKGKAISADKLSNSEELNSYVEFARTQAKADFFAIGVSYITDDGINSNTGKNMATGNVFVKIYSTQDGEVIASGSLSEIASSTSADGARVNVANKIGNELGEVLSKKIQDYWKKRTMYGQEYIIKIMGKFLPMERITLNKAISQTEGVEQSKLRTSDDTYCEYTVTYNGEDSIADAIFMNLAESRLADKFSKYDYKVSGNNVTFKPI